MNELNRRLLAFLREIHGQITTPDPSDVDDMLAMFSQYVTEDKCLVNNLTTATKALQDIENTPFDIEGYQSAKEAAIGMNARASKALSEYT